VSARLSATDWLGAFQAIAEAADHGPERVSETLLLTVTKLSRADSCVLVSWQEGQPRVLASTGRGNPLPTQRPQEGVAAVHGRSCAVATLHGDVDLVAWLAHDQAPFGVDELRTLRVLAAFAVRAADRSREALSSLYEVATKLLASTDLEEVLLAVATTAAQVLGAEIAGILLVDETGRYLDMRCVVGHRTVGTARLRVSRGQGLAGKVFATRRPARVDDWASDPTITKEFLSIAREEGTQSALGAPMQVTGRTIGALCVWRRRRSVFTDEQERIMVALADLATVAVDRAETQQRESAATAALKLAHRELEQRWEEAQRALLIHEQLSQIAVQGSELPAVVAALRSLTGGGQALIVDDEAHPLAGGESTEPPLLDRLRDWLRHRPAELSQPSYLLESDGDDQLRVVLVPIHAAGHRWGFLALELGTEPGPSDTVAAQQAATVCALLLARQEATVAATRRVESEFIWDLLEGRLTDEAEAIVRARQLGRDIRGRRRVLVLSASGWERRIPTQQWSPEQLERARHALAHAITEGLAGVDPAARVHARRADIFVALMPDLPDDHDATRRFGEAAVSAVRSAGLAATVGIGGAVNSPLGFPEGYRQARLALSLASYPQQPVVDFAELGVVQFLLAPAHRADLQRFVEQTLGALIAYDRDRDAKLIPTLEAYLDCDCSLRRAAERLYVHPKTMRYRMQRISTLAGLSLTHQEDRFRVELALKILGVLSTATPDHRHPTVPG
jgi:sugar diacid utilization regulator/putative methionine-R-sulfoxide reductase with GAF domain